MEKKSSTVCMKYIYITYQSISELLTAKKSIILVGIGETEIE